MNTHARFLILIAMLLSFLLGCSQQDLGSRLVSQPVSVKPLQPGEQIEEMVITTGVERAFPLWSFCLPTRQSDQLITAHCSEISFDRLAIGHTFGVMDLMPSPVEWEELTWELTVDGYPIDLEAFGTHNFVHPDLALNQSPVREVFRTVKVWNIVLEDLTPGVHTLQGQAQSEERTYKWIVNFTVANPSGN